MRIASAASAFPKYYYSQKFLLERLQNYWGDRLKNFLLLARLHRNVTVDGRYLAIPAEQYLEIKTWGQANDIWIKVAQELGEQALCLALHNAGLKPHDLGALLFHDSHRNRKPVSTQAGDGEYAGCKAERVRA
jgi:alkylresorcinol/alkylpyrone synthase